MDENNGLLKLYYDDSSDEEENNNVDFSKKAAQFGLHARSDNNLFSKFDSLAAAFYNYYYGLLVYHSPEVRKVYSYLKQQYLHGSEIPSEELFHNWIETAIYHAINVELKVDEHPGASRKFIKACQESITEAINFLINTCMKNLRGVIKSVCADIPLNRELEESIEKVSEEISGFVLDAKNYEDFRYIDFTPPQHVTSDNLLRVESIRDWLENKYTHELAQIDQVSGWVNNDGFPNAGVLTTPKKKNISSSKDTKKICDKVLTGYQLSDLQKEYIRKIKAINEEADPVSFTQEFKDDFLKLKLQLLINREQQKGIHSILQQGQIRLNARLETSAFSEIADYMEDFIPYDSSRFEELLQSRIDDVDIQREFFSQLRTTFGVFEKYVSRKTLPLVHTHSITSVPEYVASLKLTNRSIIRTNKNHSLPSVLGDDKEENHDYGWKFPASETYIAIERNRVTKKARSALMPIQTNSNAYEDILIKIKKIKLVKKTSTLSVAYHVSDKDIAIWARQVLHCKPLTFRLSAKPEEDLSLTPRERQDLSMFIIQLAHLLGGIEPMRYPGAVIENQMALDLIISKDLTWEEALNPNNTDKTFLPMSMKKATHVSRALMLTFKRFTPYTHNYPGDESSTDSPEFNTFIAAENNLTDKWFAFFKKSNPNVKFVDHAQALKDSIPRWYPGVTLK